MVVGRRPFTSTHLLSSGLTASPPRDGCSAFLSLSVRLALCRIPWAAYDFLCPLAALPLAAGEPSLLSSWGEPVAQLPSLKEPQLSAQVSVWAWAAGWPWHVAGSCPHFPGVAWLPGCLVRRRDVPLLCFSPRSFKRSDPINPYHVGSGYVFAPATSANDSEISSDALTDDSMSMTDSSV